MLKHVVIDRTTGRVLSVEDDPGATDIDPQEYIRRKLHDCPECRAAMARGERPQFVSAEDLAEAVERARPRGFARRPRWRTFKRRS
jgi:hypothetical protein